MPRYFVVACPQKRDKCMAFFAPGDLSFATPRDVFLLGGLGGVEPSIQAGDWLGVDSLTGCLGLVCIAYNPDGGLALEAIALHDQDPPYELAIQALRKFTRVPGRRYSLVFSFGNAGSQHNPGVLDVQRHLVTVGALAKRDIYAEYTMLQAKDFFCELYLQPGLQNIVTGGQAGVLVMGADLYRPPPPPPPRITPPLQVMNDKDPRWHKDDDAKSCERCTTPFTVFFRRHHCRHCGKVICKDCVVERTLSDGGEKVKFCKICSNDMYRVDPPALPPS